MLPSLRKQRKSWVFAPEFPLFIIYKVNARDASGVILYIAYFTSESTTIATRQLSDYEIHQSSIFRECLSFRDVYASLEILSCFYLYACVLDGRHVDVPSNIQMSNFYFINI